MKEIQAIKPPKFILLFFTIFLSIVGATLLFCSLFMPPLGEIHPSVISSFGMILVFLGCVCGINFNSSDKMYKAISAIVKALQEEAEENRANHRNVLTTDRSMD